MIGFCLSQKRYRFLIIILCSIAFILLVILLGVIGYVNNKKERTFYAVFLDNGQVYFGKINNKNTDEVVLDDVYYLKANADLTEDSDAQLSLIKLGNELYHPRDRMIINHSHVLFLEEMQPESVIMKAINKYDQS